MFTGMVMKAFQLTLKLYRVICELMKVCKTLAKSERVTYSNFALE